MENNIGKKVIIRGDRSGVEFGTLVAYKGNEVTLRNARRIWYWDGGERNLKAIKIKLKKI